MSGLKLWMLAAVLGLGFAGLTSPGVFKPADFARTARRFPRHIVWGYPMMLIATAWFLFYVKQENVADFAQWKSLLYALFTCVGVGACCFLQDYLAVRGLAVLLLLGAKLVVDTARPVESDWRLVLVTWAYLWVVTGIWLTISPWRLRDWITWATANDGRFRTVCAACTAFGLALAIIGLTAIRSAEQRPLALAPVTVCPSGMCVVANS